MLESNPANRVALEPNAILRFFETRHPDKLNERDIEPIITLIGSFGLGPSKTAKRLIVKFSSTNVVFAPFLRQCFPKARFIFMVREPSQVIASNDQTPPPFLTDNNAFGRAMKSLGQLPLDPRSVAERSARYLKAILHSAWENRSCFDQVIDYRDFVSDFEKLLRFVAPEFHQSEEIDASEALGVWNRQMHSKRVDQKFCSRQDDQKVKMVHHELGAEIVGPISKKWRKYLMSHDIKHPQSDEES